MNNNNNRNNRNNMFNQMGGNGRGQIPINPMMTMGKPTNSALKFLIVMLIGILPLLLCSIFIYDPTMVDDFKQWGEGFGQFAIIEVQYGFMWLIGLSVYLAIFPMIVLLTKINKEIKLDVVPFTSAAALAMLNMFVIPHSSRWFLLLSIPSFAIIGFIIGVVVMAVMIMNTLQRQMNQLQDNPEFKQFVDEVQKMQQNNPNFNNGRPINNGQTKPNQPKKEDFKDNPFVDVPEEDEE